MNVLIGCLLFKDFTGSEMYVFELAKNLVKLGVSVTVASPYIGGPLTNLAIKENINVIKFDELRNKFNLKYRKTLNKFRGSMLYINILWKY